MLNRATPIKTTAPVPYIASVDLMRGLVMVLMALDHVRGFFTDADFSPTDLSRTNSALFFTRWVTHLCAPAFVFLAGASAFLSTTRGLNRSQLAARLFIRGLWLVLLEITVVRFAFFFNLDYSEMRLQVIWALGWSMVVLSALVYLPLWAIAGFGLIMIFSHNLLDGLRLEDFQAANGSLEWQGWLLAVLHVPHLTVVYPLIPWIGVMAAGYAFGSIMQMPVEVRRRLTLKGGVVLIVTFVILRALNDYGDPEPWNEQETALFTLLSFVNTTKYPPSLLFLLMTLGPMFVLLSAFEQAPSTQRAIGRFFITFGRVPLFFYLLHLYVIHGLVTGFAYVMVNDVSSFLTYHKFFPPWWGFSLPVVYLIWAGVVILLYPVSYWFAGVKARHKGSWWTSYV
ncbi:MAG TPA: heparan-alpha-glucosaminide N-acetyltransferase domain-containing protein [Nitrosospira sp.]|nr:heparan-alpha-glucosaminide N-acetyltransferase domain-containing protein [Nitrosospira sp.]